MDLNVNEVLAFVLSRETDEGGFSFAQTTPRTLDDTYYASRTFEALGYDHPSPKARGYIADFEVDGFTPAKVLHQAAYLSHSLHLPHRPLADLIAFRLSSLEHAASDRTFEDLYFLITALPCVPTAFQADPALCSFISGLSIPHLRTMEQVFRQLRLMHQWRIPFDSRAYVTWIQDSQNGDGGFGFFPGTTSFLENTHRALQALTMLGSAPRDLQGCRAFVQRCRAASGGFGRQSHTVPTVDSTYRAVSSLLLLSKTEAG